MLPLHVAAGVGHTGAVEVLLSARAALDAKDAAHRGAERPRKVIFGAPQVAPQGAPQGAP